MVVLVTLALYASIALVVAVIVLVVVLMYANGERPLQPCLLFVDGPVLALLVLAALFVLHALLLACCCRRRCRRSRGIHIHVAVALALVSLHLLVLPKRASHRATPTPQILDSSHLAPKLFCTVILALNALLAQPLVYSANSISFVR